MPTGFTPDNVPDQKGRTTIVTGANTGLGFHVARHLARKGAQVVLACRSEAKAQEAMQRIAAESPRASLAFLELDLGDLQSVRSAAETARGYDRIDVLINNAGVMIPPLTRTAQGFESQFGINHLGHFALTALLLDKIGETPNARIVTTASLAHKSGHIDFDDPNAERGYSRIVRYQMSKLANLLFAYELDRRLRARGADTLSVACHPGIADTELSRYLPGIMVSLIRPFVGPFFNSAEQGAWPTLMAATAPEVKGGQYFGPSKRGETTGPAVRVGSTRASHDEALARRLWDLSIELTGIDPGI